MTLTECCLEPPGIAEILSAESNAPKTMHVEWHVEPHHRAIEYGMRGEVVCM